MASISECLSSSLLPRDPAYIPLTARISSSSASNRDMGSGISSNVRAQANVMLTDLPLDVWPDILLQLDSSDILALRGVCRGVKRLVEECLPRLLNTFFPNRLKWQSFLNCATARQALLSGEAYSFEQIDFRRLFMSPITADGLLEKQVEVIGLIGCTLYLAPFYRLDEPPKHVPISKCNLRLQNEPNTATVFVSDRGPREIRLHQDCFTIVYPNRLTIHTLQGDTLNSYLLDTSLTFRATNISAQWVLLQELFHEVLRQQKIVHRTTGKVVFQGLGRFAGFDNTGRAVSLFLDQGHMTMCKTEFFLENGRWQSRETSEQLEMGPGMRHNMPTRYTCKTHGLHYNEYAFSMPHLAPTERLYVRIYFSIKDG